MLNCAVYSDASAAANETARAVESLFDEMGVECVTAIFDNLNRLYHASKNNAFDLIVTDTAASGIALAGVDFVRRLRGEGNFADVIFLSEKEEEAFAASVAYPTAFLLRPLTRRTLRPPLVYIAGKRGVEPTFYLKRREGGRVTLRASEVDYIEVYGTELYVHTRNATVECTGSLTEALASMPEGLFYRAHRSFAVNLSQVEHYEPYEFFLKSGERVTIAKNRFAEAKAALKKWDEDGMKKK